MKPRRKDRFEKVARAVAKGEVERLVKDLVGTPSHADVPTREKAVAELLNEFLVDEGIASKLRPVEKNRPNVVAILEGGGGGKRLMLNGHTDTVPAYDMDIPPFEPSVKQGRLYGRGALDMKGGLGAMAMAMVALRRARVPLVGDVILTAVIGEEQRSEGTEDIVLRGPSADLAIVGEPTNMEVQPSHRGLEWLEVHIYGKAAHGGLAGQGVNAISGAAKFINLLETDLMPRISARRSRHTLPPTLNLGVISGGQQPSSVADHCVIRMDRRWIPEEDLKQVFQEIHDLFDKLTAENPEFKAALRRDPASMKTMTHVPNVVRRDHRIVRVLEESVEAVTGKRPPITSFWGWSDAALLTAFAKTPTVIFGPGGEGAHAKVEYVLTDHLIKCTRVYARAALEICGPPRRD